MNKPLRIKDISTRDLKKWVFELYQDIYVWKCGSVYSRYQYEGYSKELKRRNWKIEEVENIVFRRIE